VNNAAASITPCTIYTWWP